MNEKKSNAYWKLDSKTDMGGKSLLLLLRGQKNIFFLRIQEK